MKIGNLAILCFLVLLVAIVLIIFACIDLICLIVIIFSMNSFIIMIICKCQPKVLTAFICARLSWYASDRRRVGGFSASPPLLGESRSLCYLRLLRPQECVRVERDGYEKN